MRSWGLKAEPTGMAMCGEGGVKLAAKGCSGCSFYSINTGGKLNQPVLVLCGISTRGTSQKFLSNSLYPSTIVYS